MSYYCPVCNGLQSMSVLCPACRQAARDFGRTDDFLGPYSPYRPIDDLKLTNGFPDLINHECVHLMYCENCRNSFMVNVKEWVE